MRAPNFGAEFFLLIYLTKATLSNSNIATTKALKAY